MAGFSSSKKLTREYIGNTNLVVYIYNNKTTFRSFLTNTASH